MLIVEQFTTAHSHSISVPLVKTSTSDVQFDVDLDELEREQGLGPSEERVGTSTQGDSNAAVKQQRAFPLTIGLVMHGLADGLALGASALSDAGAESSSDLSLVVFLALLIHKGMSLIKLLAPDN